MGAGPSQVCHFKPGDYLRDPGDIEGVPCPRQYEGGLRASSER